MGIGVSVFLLAAGAILLFAVETTVNGVDLDTIGVILMIAGAIGLLVDLVVFAPRRRHVSTTTSELHADPYARTPVVHRDEVI